MTYGLSSKNIPAMIHIKPLTPDSRGVSNTMPRHCPVSPTVLPVQFACAVHQCRWHMQIDGSAWRSPSVARHGRLPSGGPGQMTQASSLSKARTCQWQGSLATDTHLSAHSEHIRPAAQSLGMRLRRIGDSDVSTSHLADAQHRVPWAQGGITQVLDSLAVTIQVGLALLQQVVRQNFDEDDRRHKLVKLQEHEVAVLGGVRANVKRYDLHRCFAVLLQLQDPVKLRRHHGGATDRAVQHRFVQ